MAEIEKKLDQVLLPLIAKHGYVRPSSEMLFVSRHFFISVSYDPRERMAVRIGMHGQVCAPQFIRLGDINIYKHGRIYETELRALSINPQKFIQACGGDEPRGIRLPNFETAFSEIGYTLSQVEESLNKQRQADA